MYIVVNSKYNSILNHRYVLSFTSLQTRNSSTRVVHTYMYSQEYTHTFMYVLRSTTTTDDSLFCFTNVISNGCDKTHFSFRQILHTLQQLCLVVSLVVLG